MTIQQEVHQMIDGLNVKGLNYIVEILKGLDAANWITVQDKVSLNKDEIHLIQKKEAAQRLREGRKKYEGCDLMVSNDALSKSLVDKYGGTLS